MVEQPTEEQVKEKINTAVDLLFHLDTYLFETDVNERSISHKFASYLQEEFKGWDVDCEYNRDHNDPKILHLLKISTVEVRSDDVQARTVYPDIIVHHRGKKANLLVIEIKKTSNQLPNDFDIQKLEEYKRQLGYIYALFLRFNTGRDGIGIKEEEWI
jgi:hypothetical protein